ncbi:hypothetical protein Scani_74880 [Streptomyces caniferus]|uniref:Uncharacterized protein n=1 Tax=Streptomyces caniferus TaxID=285557 RepID=A0A640SJR5_9ACTN|nr:hypothetical protein Scani_74880 [Streptomyces caniferus]
MLSKGGGEQVGGRYEPFSPGRSAHRRRPRVWGSDRKTGPEPHTLSWTVVPPSPPAQPVKDTSVTPCRYAAPVYPSAGVYGIAVIHTTT